MKIRKLSNKGAALPTVIMVMLVTMTLAGIVLSLVTSQTKTEAFYENNISALHAAEAGLNQYLWDLNKDTGTPIALDTVIKYPDFNPVAAFTLKQIENTTSKKVIKATGWMLSDPSVTRTIETTFTKRTFTQYVYFSDNDPETIWWSSSDNLYGPYHSNTYLCVAGSPTFWGKATYVIDIKKASGYTYNPDFKKGVTKVTKEDYPSNNSQLMSYASSGGYYYEGRTSIRLNSNGTIKVWNPNHTPTTETRNLPTNGVIYVNERAGASNDKFDPDNGNVFVSGVLDGRLTVAAKKDIYITGYDPTVYNLSSSPVTNGITYKDTGFNLNTSTGVVTVNETAGQDEADMLGLIADRHVAVLTYGWFNNNSIDTSCMNFNIYGAVFAINGSFVNSYQINSDPSSTYPTLPGILTVRGAIIQKERGAVSKLNYGSGTVATGYKKNYAHDPRLMYDSPPYFLEPTESGWEIRDWKDIN